MAKRHEVFNKITEKQRALSEEWLHYWKEFSSFHTWQFWLLIAFFVIPLVVTYLKIDRKNALLLGFYGFNVHVWLSYVYRFGTNQGYWGYPYQMIVQLPNSVVLDASLIPVLFIFVYQWTLHKKKNYYIYTLLLSTFLSFVFKPLLALHHFFELYQGATYFHLFIGYLIILVLSKQITNIFSKFTQSR